MRILFILFTFMGYVLGTLPLTAQVQARQQAANTGRTMSLSTQPTVGSLPSISPDPQEDLDAPSQRGGGVSVSGLSASDGPSRPGRTRGWYACNNSPHSRIRVAIASMEDGKWVKSGWYDLAQRDCVQLQARLTERYAYYFASADSRVWSGDHRLCVDVSGATFRHEQGMRCPSGYRAAGFKRVDFGSGASFTLNLQ